MRCDVGSEYSWSRNARKRCTISGHFRQSWDPAYRSVTRTVRPRWLNPKYTSYLYRIEGDIHKLDSNPTEPEIIGIWQTILENSDSLLAPFPFRLLWESVREREHGISETDKRQAFGRTCTRRWNVAKFYTDRPDACQKLSSSFAPLSKRSVHMTRRPNLVDSLHILLQTHFLLAEGCL